MSHGNLLFGWVYESTFLKKKKKNQKQNAVLKALVNIVVDRLTK